MPRETEWGIEQVMPLLAPLNGTNAKQDIFNINKGGPSLANNGINRDGGVAELYEANTALGTGQYGYVSANGIPVVVDTLAGNIYSPNANSTLTSPLYPSDTLYPSESLYPSGGYGNVWAIGKLNYLNSPQFFNKYQMASYYLDCVVASSPSSGVTTSTGYTIIGIRLGSTSTFVLDEVDPVNGTVYNSVTLTVANTFNRTGVAMARANTLTWASVKNTSGFIYNVGNVVYYHVNGTDYNTTKNSDINQQNFSCYYQPTATGNGIVLFSTTYRGVSAVWHNTSSAINTWSEIQDSGATTHGVMMGDFGAYVLNTANTTVGLTLGVTTYSQTVPAYWINVTYAGSGSVSSVTGYGAIGTGNAGAYTGGGLYSGGTSAANFKMIDGIVTPYGCCGIYEDTSTSYYGNFHGSTSEVNVTSNSYEPNAYPQLDVIHKMLVVRSYNGSISLLCANATAFGDSYDCGNIINDFSGGTFGYDIMGGNPFNGNAKSFFFYPLSWRGSTSYGNPISGVTLYKLNNGQFVSVCTSTVPQFSEIAPGVITINNMGAWGSIIDLNSGVLHYNYSGYTPSFFCNNSNTADNHSVCYLKIFDTYSTSIDEGQVYGDYSYVAAMAIDANGGKCLPYGWTAWDGQTDDYLGNYISYTLGGVSAIANNLQSNGSYTYNANVPPGGDSSFTGGGINMLNATAIQSQNYYGYYLFSSGGGSNLLTWRFANVFIVHGIYYACNLEYIYMITMSNGTQGTIQGTPTKVAYAIGMQYLCASPEKAYFLSSFDNSIFYFDGGQTLNKIFEFNQKPTITSAVYVVRDNALYLQTLSSIITVREESSRWEAEQAINAEPLQMTENTPPLVFSSYSLSYMKATSNGLYFLCGNNYATWQYESGSSIIPLNYQTAYVSPGEFQTFEVGRITGQVLCTRGFNSGTLNLILNYLLPDGTSGTL